MRRQAETLDIASPRVAAELRRQASLLGDSCEPTAQSDKTDVEEQQELVQETDKTTDVLPSLNEASPNDIAQTSPTASDILNRIYSTLSQSYSSEVADKLSENNFEMLVSLCKVGRDLASEWEKLIQHT